jgi:hypothetical protein
MNDKWDILIIIVYITNCSTMILVQHNETKKFMISGGEDKAFWTHHCLQASEWTTAEWAWKAVVRRKLEKEIKVIRYSMFEPPIVLIEIRQ